MKGIRSLITRPPLFLESEHLISRTSRCSGGVRVIRS